MGEETRCSANVTGGSPHSGTAESHREEEFTVWTRSMEEEAILVTIITDTIVENRTGAPAKPTGKSCASATSRPDSTCRKDTTKTKTLNIRYLQCFVVSFMIV